VAPDRDLAEWVVGHRLGALDWLFVALSRIGTSGFVWIALAVVIAIATRNRLVLLTPVFVLLADALALALKVTVDRPRPHLDPLVRVPTDYSFPSGHAATSFAGATMLSSFAPRLAPAFYLLAAAIAFSRVYVGVHYPLDVLGGAAVGVAVGWLGVRALRRLGRSRPRSPAAQPPG
jgi:undecaprenyl-diphosphatase